MSLHQIHARLTVRVETRHTDDGPGHAWWRDGTETRDILGRKGSRTTEWLRFRCSGHPDTCPAVALVRYRALEEALEALR